MGNIHSLNIGGSTYVIEPQIINVTNKTSGMAYLAFVNDKTSGGRYTYSYSHAFMNNSTGEMQIPHLRLKHTNNTYGSYLWFGDSNYAYIFENPDDKLIYLAKKHTITATVLSEGIHLDGFTYFLFGAEPKANNTTNLGSSSKKFKATYSTTFYGNLTGNADTASQIKVTATSTSENYPLILGPSTTVGGPILTGNKSLYTNSANNLYYNPSTNDLTLNSGYIIMPTDDKKGIIPATNNYGQIGFSDRKFWKMHASTFVGNLSGNANTATNATNSTYINVASSSTNNGTYMLTFVNGTGNRKAYTNSGVCVNPYSKTIIADQIRGFGTGSWGQDYAKATTYNGSISSGSSWSPVCAVRTSGGVWSMGHLWPGNSQNYLTFSYVGDSVRAANGNVTLNLPVPKANRTNFIPIGDQQYDGKPAVARIVTLSSSQYTSLTTKDPNTLYLII